ncbi:MAG: FRG domain-containing protein [Treponemataceae bacterium]|nr:FRG domain-containing protein [Treponemataceae bacterium]
MNSEQFYFEHTIKFEKDSYLKLLDMYFKPKTFFDDVERTLGEDQKKELDGESLFDKIFPEKADYLDNHKSLENRQAFLAWNGWCFRGHKDSTWKLETTFERLCYKNNGTQGKDLFDLENGMIREFRRRIQKYDPSIATIDPNDFYMLLANMQHYGCATRFLDMTFSFFVALFFACGYIEFEKIEEDENKKDSESGSGEPNSAVAETSEREAKELKKQKIKTFSIYCFNRMWIEKTYKDNLPKKLKKLYASDNFGKMPKTQEAVWNFVPNYKDCVSEVDRKNIFKSVINMTPFYMNVRLDRQKGTFLIPTNPYCTFEENLKSLVEKDKKNGKFRILKINVEYDDAMLLYYQKFLDEMNINHAVLFNDVENICKQINYKTRLPNDALVSSNSKY